MKATRPIAPLLVLLLAACGPPADQAADAMDAQAGAAGEPALTTGRTPQFENEHVTVWKSVIVPNQPLEMHRHDNPRAIIALKGGTLTVVNDAGERHDMTWETGNAYWLEADPPGELHGDVNEGPEPVEVIVVQLKGVSE
ncbi:MAG: hypothetical protein OXU74_10855 [Gemmatimonadota bacterium]|nr:hypothetical protein [Gemmatimonadota bacterium]